MAYTIVYIGAAWCKTCKEIKPKTLELAQRFGLAVDALDYDDDLDEEQKAQVTKVPTLRILKDGAQVAEYNVNQVASLSTWLTTNVSMTVGDEDF
jgi:thiol-disulfide isomerase/thioredoxin